MLEALLLAALAALSLLAVGHVLLHKRDPRAAFGWVVFCCVLPGLGPLGYWLVGINRIRTRARDWQAKLPFSGAAEAGFCSWSLRQGRSIAFGGEGYAALVSLADAVTRRPLLPGNRVVALHNGEQTFPAMLEAIASARDSVYLASYIFDTDDTGKAFVEALKQAADRGLDVRVLVDGLGERYSFPVARRLFKGSAVAIGRFLPPALSGRGLHFNLRNHRKLLIIDNWRGFTGGMNISDRHLAARPTRKQAIDVHFGIEGPVVGQMLEAFMEDWYFATGEVPPPISTPPPLPGGTAFCRGVSAGPNEDFEKLRWIILGAIGCARHRLRIMTPYFIPDRTLVAALNAAALRGVEVDILLPAKNNLPYVAWASRAYFSELLEHGCRIYYQPPPFVHSKLLLVDDQYALVGSANLDPRSLRLNFEFNLEVFDARLVADLTEHVDSACGVAREVTQEQVDGLPVVSRLRDNFAKLFSPYL
ncbi:cardiolipin synthase [Syntrophotalea acetylenivorans]|uniref:Cardiolipin synthase n=1 Tax=Syntrophotalea acetylenivorans TaxID=1842532 RepID=A0A1L3GQH6_9BACT|nr:phospholipase D-like domain-containing protein [Syntrophotalea acetylenivorans]APG28155.1 cardiolipin synthase [Syntrophotalea acetylenivorans]